MLLLILYSGYTIIFINVSSVFQNIGFHVYLKIEKLLEHLIFYRQISHFLRYYGALCQVRKRTRKTPNNSFVRFIQNKRAKALCYEHIFFRYSKIFYSVGGKFILGRILRNEKVEHATK